MAGDAIAITSAGRGESTRAADARGSSWRRALEDSVIEQVRSSLKAEEARQQLGLSDAEWQSLGESVSGEGIRNLIRRVSYDGARGAVSVEFGQ